MSEVCEVSKAEPAESLKSEVEEFAKSKAKYVFTRSVKHGTAKGARLSFVAGDEPEGLTKAEIRLFLEKGFLKEV